MYCTVPAVALLGLINAWLIEFPEPPDAPVIPPVMVPTVQAKLDGVVAVRGMLVVCPLQILAAGFEVICGMG